MIKKFKGGEIHYKYPNYAEAQILLGQIGFGREAKEEQNQEMILMGKVLEFMGKFITHIKMKDIKDYDSLLNSPEYAQELSPISVEIINKILDFSSKKKDSSDN